MSTNGKVAVLTGAASGMGTETAISFSQSGYTIICTDIDKDNLEKTVSDINTAKGMSYSVVADIAKVGKTKNLAKEIKKRIGKINLKIV